MKIDGECPIELIGSCRNKVQVYRGREPVAVSAVLPEALGSRNRRTLILGWAYYLDAFSSYPLRTWLPNVYRGHDNWYTRVKLPSAFALEGQSPPARGNHCTPPLPFGRPTPHRNCLPETVPWPVRPDTRPGLNPHGKENGIYILQSIDHGPFELGTTRDTLGTTPEGGVLLGPERPHTYDDLNGNDKK
ncbi:hypothetical protein Tco_0468876 [Tanacetum coccineum]